MAQGDMWYHNAFLNGVSTSTTSLSSGVEICLTAMWGGVNIEVHVPYSGTSLSFSTYGDHYAPQENSTSPTQSVYRSMKSSKWFLKSGYNMGLRNTSGNQESATIMGIQSK